MIEIDLEGVISADILAGASMEEVEKILNDGISSRMTASIMKHIDDLDFICMELNEETNNFEYRAELVLCSKSDIVTNAQIQAQKLSAYGLTPDQIVEVLDTITANTKGF